MTASIVLESNSGLDAVGQRKCIFVTPTIVRKCREEALVHTHCELRRWWLRCCCVAWLGIAFVCPSAGAQEAPQTVAAEGTPQKSQAAEVDREISWQRLPKNFLQDQKDIWLFPVQLGKGRHWVPTIAVTGVTAALIAADPHDTPYFRRTQRFEGFNDVFSGRNTSLGMAIVPAAFLVVGRFRHVPRCLPARLTPIAPSWTL